VMEHMVIDPELENIGREQVGFYAFRELCRQRLLNC